MKKRIASMVMVIGMVVLASCTVFSQVQDEPQLEFKIAMQVNSDQEFHVSLGVHNAGERAFEGDSSFSGQMEVRHSPSGDLRASADVIPLRALEPGETAWPLNWRGGLEAGAYEVTWGAEEYGKTREDFVIVEENGHFYFQGQPLATAEPQPSDKEQRRLLMAKATADLAQHLDVVPDEVAVVSVEPFEFPDVSLGVPEPGRSYAEVVVPGFIIRLAAGGEISEYHGGTNRAVRVPEGPQPEPSAEADPAYRTTTASRLGLTLEVLAAWVQLEPELIWALEPASKLLLGVNGTPLDPPMEPEAVLLPNHAKTLTSEAVDLGWAQGRRFSLEVYAPMADATDEKATVESVETHALVTFEQGGERMGLDFYTRAPTVEELGELDDELEHAIDSVHLEAGMRELERPIPVADEAGSVGWQLLEDETYGFELGIPGDWTKKENEVEGPGVPEDWPLERSVAIFPQAWADRFGEQSGPPDPDAPPAVPALILEVIVGPMAQFRRAYPEPTREGVLEINGVRVVQEIDAVSDDVELVRYVFQHPDGRDVRIVLVDNYGGFVERRTENPEVAGLIPAVVGTFTFGN